MTQVTPPDTTAAPVPADEAPSGLLPCDLVMKGGITSGVVYPKLIARLANDYVFKSVGGTSAGAIAAAACAAAELGRQNGMNAKSFEQLAELPEQLGASIGVPAASMLFHLFQPVPSVRSHFAVLVGALNAPSPLAAALGICRSLLARFWPCALLAAVLALLMLTPAVMAVTRLTLPVALGWALALLTGWLAALALLVQYPVRQKPSIGVALVALVVALGVTVAIVHFVMGASTGMGVLVALVSAVAVPLALAVAVGLSSWRFIATLLRGLHGNFYGICSGRTEEPDRRALGLADWLTGYLAGLAGLSPQDRPLTFGDLWGQPPNGPFERHAPDTPPRDRQVNLEVMTTAVSQEMCYAIPFRDGTNSFYYDPAEWERLFPATVMRWLEHASDEQTKHEAPLKTAGGVLLKRLPSNRYLPVVVAVRMSLSFPVLLSAVPLYACDFTLPEHTVKRVWFSDGGISSNLPLHFFDAPLPGHPTFAINLKDEHPAHPIERGKKACAQDGRVYLATSNQGGRMRYWRAPPDDTPLGLVGFLLSIVDTMQNWRDEIQFPYPGYRDRIVQISQLPDEGGLNLDMPRENIDALRDAGACAAERLVQRFHPDSVAKERGGWENHEQIRLRTFLCLIEELATHPRVTDAHWDAVVEGLRGDKYNEAEAHLALRILGVLRDLGGHIAASEVSVAKDAPRPRSTMRISPRI